MQTMESQEAWWPCLGSSKSSSLRLHKSLLQVSQTFTLHEARNTGLTVNASLKLNHLAGFAHLHRMPGHWVTWCSPAVLLTLQPPTQGCWEHTKIAR